MQESDNFSRDLQTLLWFGYEPLLSVIFRYCCRAGFSLSFGERNGSADH
jgi:hypothetical protein